MNDIHQKAWRPGGGDIRLFNNASSPLKLLVFLYKSSSNKVDPSKNMAARGVGHSTYYNVTVKSQVAD